MSVPPVTSGTLTLTEVRERAAAVLAPAADGDPDVHLDVVDAVSPPAILLVWGDPWLDPETYGGGLFWAPLGVLCVAARLEPGPGVQKLEELVAYAIGRLQADSYPWPHATAQAPRVFDIAGVQYLGARVTYRVPIQIGG